MPCRYAFPLESVTVNAWPDLPARIRTAMKFPAVLATLNATDEVVVTPASWLARWTSAIPGVDGRIVKFTRLLAAPPTVTSTSPLVVPEGTSTTIFVALQLAGVPDVPLKVTVLVPCVVPKFVPAIVTDVPTAPDVGFKLVMFGADEVTIKFTPLLMSSAEPPPLGALVTTTFPVAAPIGTGTTMLVALQLVGVPAVPLKVTVLVPCVVPKFVPAIVTGVPTAPDAGFRLVMLGGGGVTAKLIPLLATPPTVTTNVACCRSCRHRRNNARRTPTRRCRRCPVELHGAHALRRSEIRTADRHRRADHSRRRVHARNTRWRASPCVAGLKSRQGRTPIVRRSKDCAGRYRPRSRLYPILGNQLGVRRCRNTCFDGEPVSRRKARRIGGRNRTQQ